MTRDLEPLPQDVAQLLARGAASVEPPTQVRARLRERLTTTMVGPVTLGSPRLSPLNRAQTLAAAVGGSRAFIGLAGFIAGAATIFALRSTPATMSPTPSPAPAATSIAGPATETPTPSAEARPEIRQVVPSRANEVPAAVPMVRRRPLVQPPVAVAVAEHAVPAAELTPQPIAPMHVSHSSLQVEGELLQKGRTAMVRGDSEGALAAVEEHASRFPRGKLAEEREALKIQALVAEDRGPEAHVALAAFHQTYPNSLLGPALEEAVVGKIQ